MVRPETVVGWHRPRIPAFLVLDFQAEALGSTENESRPQRFGVQAGGSQSPVGALRIHGELLKLGIEISERTVSRLMPKRRKPPF